MLVGCTRLTHSEGFDCGQGRGVHGDRSIAFGTRLRRPLDELVVGLDERATNRHPLTLEVGPLERDQFATTRTGCRCQPDAHGEVVVDVLSLGDDRSNLLRRRWLDLGTRRIRLGCLDARIRRDPSVADRTVERRRQESMDLLALVLARTSRISL